MDARKNVAPEFVLGDGALTLVGRYAANFSAKKIFLVTDPGIVASGWVTPVTDSLANMDIPVVLFTGVSNNPRDHEVMRGADIYLSEGCDSIVALGGGSPMDCAKGIGIVACNGGHIIDFAGIDRVRIPGPPLICIPTTAGSSADVSQFAIVDDTKRRVKVAIVSKAAIPDVALIDPRTTTTMPAQLTAATGMDALTHAIEAYLSLANSPVTDLHALEAIRLVINHLPAAIQHPLDISQRDRMTLGSLLAGLAFSNAGLGMVHAMAHALGGLLDLPHGVCNALLLEHVLILNFDHSPERCTKIANLFGIDTAMMPVSGIKKALFDAIRALRHKVGLTKGLSDYGVGLQDIPQLSEFAFRDPCLATNPGNPTLENIEKIYEQALAAER